MEIERENLLNTVADAIETRPQHKARLSINRNVYTQDQYDAKYAQSNATKSNLSALVKRNYKPAHPDRLVKSRYRISRA
ncbi:hypothetical protein DPMN_034684 [Dreissena polymorpha]|uniref:Uncharacterized protein n=1 Tax=Dreissena polymorpha TaxID=45954 RepID=A0A9D4MAK0_DREPO|nr:hypothetical protein DPMN_034684 [Dreissena polymorpha]